MPEAEVPALPDTEILAGLREDVLQGGYYLIDVDNLDTALEWAGRIPLAPYGSVEVRPLMELPPQ